MKRVFVFFLLLISIYIHNNIYAQNQRANNWYFGRFAGISFNSTPTASTSGGIDQAEGVATISDNTGNLLFYTDGQRVWDRTHTLMPSANGTSPNILNGHFSSTQSGVIVPNPANPNKYYIFTVPAVEILGTNTSAYWSEVDMTLNSGMGDVVVATRNTLLFTNSSEKITAVRHQNGTDIWVIFHDIQYAGNTGNNFYAYLINGTGLVTTPVISSTGIVCTSGATYAAAGPMKVSHDGRMIAVTYRTSPGKVQLLPFDNSTGRVGTPLTTFDYTGKPIPHGVEFSPNNRILYVSAGSYTMASFDNPPCPTNSPYYSTPAYSGTYGLYQYDLSHCDSIAINSSEITLHQNLAGSLGEWGGQAQLGPDGKIYIARATSRYIGVIANPNTLGAGCTYTHNGFDLAPSGGCHSSVLGLPNFVDDFVAGVDSVSFQTSNSRCDSVKFTGYFGSTFDSLQWNFGDTVSGITNNHSSLASPYHFYSDSGIFHVQIILYDRCYTDTIRKTIHIRHFPDPVVSDSISLGCSAATIIDASGSTGVGLTYSWSTSNGVIVSGGSSPVVSVSGSGDYLLTLTSSNGCYNQQMVNVSGADTLSITGNSDNLLCNGINTGAAFVNVTGGTAGYNYSWSHNAILNNDTATSLAAGNYTVNVTDMNGCTSSHTFTITEPDSMHITNTLGNVLCYGDSSGYIDLNVSGGNPGYTYSWNHDATLNNDTAIALIEGNYTVNISDANGCTASRVFSITQPDSIHIANTLGNVLCYGDSSGYIDLNVSGGNPGYTYNWSHDATLNNDTAIALPEGNYIVTVTDNNNCTATKSYSITSPSLLNNSIITNDADCTGNNGTAVVNTTGGTPPYNYTWSYDSTITINTTNNIPAGMQNVIISDNNGCMAIINFSIGSIDAPQVFLSSTSVLCKGENTGTATVDSILGDPGFSFAWYDILTNPIGQYTPTATGLSAGTYIVEVTDTNHCTVYETINVSEPNDFLLVNITSITDPVCAGSNTGSIVTTVTGGTSPVSFDWSPVSNTDSIFDQATAGNYTVTVTDYNGCTNTNTITLTDPDSLSVEINIDSVSCFDGSNGAAEILVSGGDPGYTYEWIGLPNTTSSVNTLTAGDYQVIISDNSGCSDSIQVNIPQPDSIYVVIDQVELSECGKATGSIELHTSGGVAPYQYAWNNGSITEDINNISAGTYILNITDHNNCNIAWSYAMDCNTTLTIPQFFSPNGDGINDTWHLDGLDLFPGASIEIYNRWGNIVYSAVPFNNDWNGVSNGASIGSEKLPNATYFYQLNLGNNTTMKTGYLELQQ